MGLKRPPGLTDAGIAIVMDGAPAVPAREVVTDRAMEAWYHPSIA